MASTPRHAPRLSPQERLAPHLRRRGRFAKIDPLEPRPFPTWPKVVGVLGWAGLLGGAGYTAWKRSQERPEADGSP